MRDGMRDGLTDGRTGRITDRMTDTSSRITAVFLSSYKLLDNASYLSTVVPLHSMPPAYPFTVRSRCRKYSQG